MLAIIHLLPSSGLVHQLHPEIYATYQEYSMKYIYSTSQMSKLSLTLHTFSVTGSVASLFLKQSVWLVEMEHTSWSQRLLYSVYLNNTQITCLDLWKPTNRSWITRCELCLMTSLIFYLYFSSFTYRLFSTNIFTTSSITSSYPSSSSILTIILSMKLATSLVLIKSYRISFIIVWNIAGELVSSNKL